MDPIQFAYRANLGAEDATLTWIKYMVILKRPAHTSVYFLLISPLLSIWSSSIFPCDSCVIIKSVAALILWLRQFLRERHQRVCINNTFSDCFVLNSGVPQACVLSPLLFSNTNDDMALVVWLQDVTCPSYSLHINQLFTWSDSSFLYLNFRKTK